MISPTGKGIRNDSMGLGTYGVPRGGRSHKGTDYLCDPGQKIRSPISGKVKRLVDPYGDRKYSGLVIVGKHMTIKMMYFKPKEDLVSTTVKAGEVIGIAQDISARYDIRMKPHIHLQIDSTDPDLFISMFS